MDWVDMMFAPKKERKRLDIDIVYYMLEMVWNKHSTCKSWASKMLDNIKDSRFKKMYSSFKKKNSIKKIE